MSGLIQVVCHSSVLVSYFFLGNIRNGGMKWPVGFIKVTTVTRDPVLRIEEKISDAYFSIPIFSCVFAVQY
jgi:hypothetical protein